MNVDAALELFAERPQDPQDHADPARRRPRLSPARPVRPHALRGRGPARQARRRAGPARHRPDPLRPRRADDRPAHRRRPQAPRTSSTAWPTWATRSSSSSTTWRSSRPPTGSSTSAPRPAKKGGSIVAAGPPEVDRQGEILPHRGDPERVSSPPAPHAERPRFDPKAAAKKVIAEVKAAREVRPEAPRPRPLGKKTADAGTPSTGSAGSGKPARWDGKILDPGRRPPRTDRRLPRRRLDPERAVVKVPGPDPEAPPSSRPRPATSGS